MPNPLNEARERMQKSVDAFQSNLSTVRTGRANPAVLGRVVVEYYGAMTPLAQLANISTPDPRTLLITPFDKSVAKGIEKAILEADLGFNPSNQGDSIFITVPALNDERRRDLVKSVHQLAEEARVAIRNIRRDVLTELRAAQKDGDLSEDDLRRAEADVQKATDEFIAKVDARTKVKETDILAV
ncbi:MAG TPA: ribosome recycling factor [Trueperaceae bacterium]|nr:ribosome recycling factor [Trueperaceae bacterium]